MRYKRDHFERNPRQPGNFSFEMIKYIIDESIINRLKSRIEQSINQEFTCTDETVLDDDILILHMASDFKTGLLREINSLMNLGLVSLDEKGFTSLRNGWERKIPSFILNETWDAGWNNKLDNEDKFCIHSTIREGIHTEWTRMPKGWMSCSMQKLCHDHSSFESAKQIFESNYEDSMNEIDGIAQFGI